MQLRTYQVVAQHRNGSTLEGQVENVPGPGEALREFCVRHQCDPIDLTSKSCEPVGESHEGQYPAPATQQEPEPEDTTKVASETEQQQQEQEPEQDQVPDVAPAADQQPADVDSNEPQPAGGDQQPAPG